MFLDDERLKYIHVHFDNSQTPPEYPCNLISTQLSGILTVIKNKSHVMYHVPLSLSLMHYKV